MPKCPLSFAHCLACLRGVPGCDSTTGGAFCLPWTLRRCAGARTHHLPAEHAKITAPAPPLPLVPMTSPTSGTALNHAILYAFSQIRASQSQRPRRHSYRAASNSSPDLLLHILPIIDVPLVI